MLLALACVTSLALVVIVAVVMGLSSISKNYFLRTLAPRSTGCLSLSGLALFVTGHFFEQPTADFIIVFGGVIIVFYDVFAIVAGAMYSGPGKLDTKTGWAKVHSNHAKQNDPYSLYP